MKNNNPLNEKQNDSLDTTNQTDVYSVNEYQKNQHLRKKR